MEDLLENTIAAPEEGRDTRPKVMPGVRVEYYINGRRVGMEEEDKADAGYEAWLRAKIRRALSDADVFPERRVPMADIRRRYGLEH